jgi:syntaxin 1B/2/3
VNPDASEAEVSEAAEMDWGSEGVFQTAVSIEVMWEME